MQTDVIKANRELDKLEEKLSKSEYIKELKVYRNYWFGVMKYKGVRITSYVYIEALHYIEEICRRLNEEIPSDIMDFHMQQIAIAQEYEKDVMEGKIKPNVKPQKEKVSKKKEPIIIVDKRFNLGKTIDR